MVWTFIEHYTVVNSPYQSKCDMHRLIIVLVCVAISSMGCDEEACDPLGTYTLYFTFGTGDCENLSAPWERIYTISKREGGDYNVTGDPNEEIESISATDDCKMNLTTFQIAPTEIPIDAVRLVLSWTLNNAPAGDGQLVLEGAMCQRDFVITGRAVRF